MERKERRGSEIITFFFTSFFIGTAPWTFQKRNGFKVNRKGKLFFFLCFSLKNVTNVLFYFFHYFNETLLPFLYFFRKTNRNPKINHRPHRPSRTELQLGFLQVKLNRSTSSLKLN